MNARSQPGQSTQTHAEEGEVEKEEKVRTEHAGAAGSRVNSRTVAITLTGISA
jgi:hypothetical protein